MTTHTDVTGDTLDIHPRNNKPGIILDPTNADTHCALIFDLPTATAIRDELTRLIDTQTNTHPSWSPHYGTPTPAGTPIHPTTDASHQWEEWDTPTPHWGTTVRKPDHIESTNHITPHHHIHTEQYTPTDDEQAYLDSHPTDPMATDH